MRQTASAHDAKPCWKIPSNHPDCCHDYCPPTCPPPPLLKKATRATMDQYEAAIVTDRKLSEVVGGG